MPIVLVPYHLDEFLPNLNAPLPAGHDLTAVVEELPEGDVWFRLAALYQPVADTVATQARAGGVPAVVSGDCTTSLATVAGLQRAGIEAGIVWFDAHGDVQTLETTTSGYVGGMPLRILVGYRPELIADALRLRPVPEERVVLVDARDLDPPEAEYLAGAAITRADVAALTAADLPPGPLVLHLDLDVVDAADLPGLRYPVSPGPSLPDTLAAARRVLDTGRVAALDIACTWYPGQTDPDGRRAALLAELLS